MTTEQNIEKAILETLVVENKQSLHHAVDKIMDVLAVSKISDYNKSTEQKVKDYLYSRLTDEMKKALEYKVENPPQPHPTLNIESWEADIVPIYGMVGHKKESTKNPQ